MKKSNKSTKQSNEPIGVVGRPLFVAYQLEVAIRVLGCGGASKEVRDAANALVLGYLSLS